jgi:thiamine biosynthesis protein ThiF family 2
MDSRYDKADSIACDSIGYFRISIPADTITPLALITPDMRLVPVYAEPMLTARLQRDSTLNSGWSVEGGKTQALHDILMQINPWLDIQTRQIRVTSENVLELFAGWPIVCEAFDRPDQKAMLVGSLLSQCPDTIVVSGNGMAGLGDANDIRTQQKLRRLYVCGDDTTESAPGAGLMAPRVAICAGHQANKVLQLIIGGG